MKTHNQNKQSDTENAQKVLKTYTFGCKVNLFDTKQVESSVSQFSGWQVNNKSNNPDAVVINTCTVTESADKQARQLIRKVHRDNPNAKIVVTGCYAESDSESIAKMPGVEKVVAIKDRVKINKSLGLPVLNETDSFKRLSEVTHRTRCYLKMQDGCNAYCSFCVLPYVRGRSRSIDLDVLIDLSQSYEAAGYKEMIITGTHIGVYGRDLNPRMNLASALQIILDKTKNIRLKISSLEPTTLNKSIVDLVKNNDRIVPHFHIPMQSGSNNVLRKMNRKNKSETFAKKIIALSEARKDLCIGTDIIVGFCDETEQDYLQTKQALQELPIHYAHVFPYSERPGTAANVKFIDNVLIQDKKLRVKELRQISAQKQKDFYNRFVNTETKILIENKRDKQGFLLGNNQHYIRARVKGHDRLMQQEIDVRLNSIETLENESIIYNADVI